MGIRFWIVPRPGTKLILDDHGSNLESFRISLESFRSFRGPLLHKPVTGQGLFFAVSYSTLALVMKIGVIGIWDFVELIFAFLFSIEIGHLVAI